MLEDPSCFLKVWSAQCLSWPIVTRAHAPRQADAALMRRFHLFTVDTLAALTLQVLPPLTTLTQL
jgi:hypothetical protein